MLSPTQFCRGRAAKGFTLIELMVVAALLTIIMGILVTIFLNTVTTARFQETDVRMRDESRRAIQRTVDLVRTADSNTLQLVDTTGTVVPFAPGVVGTGIFFQLPTDTDGNFSINDGTGNAEYTDFFYIGIDPDNPNILGEWTPDIDPADYPNFTSEPAEQFTRLIALPNNNADASNAPNGGFVLTVLDEDEIRIDLIMQTQLGGVNSRVVTRDLRSTFRILNDLD